MRQIRTWARKHWLRTMKSLVAWAESRGRWGIRVLQVLTVVPSGWTAAVALSKALARSDLARSLEYAERAVKLSPAVWQGHVQRASVLTRLGLEEQASIARLMGILLLAAACGTTLTISADGPDEAAAVDALSRLVESGFGESSDALGPGSTWNV